MNFHIFRSSFRNLRIISSSRISWHIKFFVTWLMSHCHMTLGVILHGSVRFENVLNWTSCENIVFETCILFIYLFVFSYVCSTLILIIDLERVLSSYRWLIVRYRISKVTKSYSDINKILVVFDIRYFRFKVILCLIRRQKFLNNFMVINSKSGFLLVWLRRIKGVKNYDIGLQYVCNGKIQSFKSIWVHHIKVM